MRKQLDERVDKGYYSNTQPGIAVFHRYVEKACGLLEEVTQAHDGLIQDDICMLSGDSFIYDVFGAWLPTSVINNPKSILDSVEIQGNG